MKKYRFPFAAVDRVRKLQRDEQRLRLADAYRAEGIVQQQQLILTTEFVELHDQQRVATSKQPLDVTKLLAGQRYELVLEAQQQTLHKQASMLADETQRRRLSAIEAERSVLVMEKLDHRLLDAHRTQERREEAKQLDEIALQRVAARRKITRPRILER